MHERGRYDRKTIYEILDAALVCHIAYVIDGQPFHINFGASMAAVKGVG